MPKVSSAPSPAYPNRDYKTYTHLEIQILKVSLYDQREKKRERESERERQRDRQRQRETERERERDRERGRQTDRRRTLF